MRVKAKMTMLADSIRTKTGVKDKLTIRDMIDTVNAFESSEKYETLVSAVNFYDYDGTCLFSFTAKEALNLRSLPPLPIRNGLVCQGWNWSLEDIHRYVKEYGICDIGAMYTTEDGKTRLYIDIASIGRMTIPFCFTQSSPRSVTVDWGDGSTPQTFPDTGTVLTSHEYKSVGEYVITLDVSDNNTMMLGSIDSATQSGVFGDISNGTNTYTAMLKRVEIGKGVSIVARAFQYCGALTEVVLPNTVESIGYCAFNMCYGLRCIVIPSGCTTLMNGAFSSCYGLNIVSLPHSLTNYQDSAHFGACYSLSRLVIPDSVSEIGQGFMNNCYGLPSIVIPSSVKSIKTGAFYMNKNARLYDFTHSTEVVSIPNRDTFNGKPADARAKVPTRLYNSWITANVWKDWNTWFVEADNVKFFSVEGTIDGAFVSNTYGFAEGTTWAEWEFCDDVHYKATDKYVYRIGQNDMLPIGDASGKLVKPTDVITNQIYTISSTGEGLLQFSIVSTPPYGNYGANGVYSVAEGITWGEWFTAKLAKDSAFEIKENKIWCIPEGTTLCDSPATYEITTDQVIMPGTYTFSEGYYLGKEIVKLFNLANGSSSIEFYYKPGWTWEEWVLDDISVGGDIWGPNGATFIDGIIGFHGQSYCICDEYGEPISPNEVIDPTRKYYYTDYPMVMSFRSRTPRIVGMDSTFFSIITPTGTIEKTAGTDMTWKNWLSSTYYNKEHSYYIFGEYIRDKVMGGKYLANADGTPVKVTDVIIDGYTYTEIDNI